MDDPIERGAGPTRTVAPRLSLVAKATSSTHGRRRSDDVVAYEVAGLPRSLAIDIAEFDGRWRLLVVRDGVYSDWQGDFENPDAALAAIERELTGFERRPAPA
jgi:hypothetical protein